MQAQQTGTQVSQVSISIVDLQNAGINVRFANPNPNRNPDPNSS